MGKLLKYKTMVYSWIAGKYNLSNYMGCQLLLHTDSILVAYTNYWITIWLINVEIFLFERLADITCVILFGLIVLNCSKKGVGGGR